MKLTRQKHPALAGTCALVVLRTVRSTGGDLSTSCITVSNVPESPLTVVPINLSNILL